MRVTTNRTTKIDGKMQPPGTYDVSKKKGLEMIDAKIAIEARKEKDEKGAISDQPQQQNKNQPKNKDLAILQEQATALGLDVDGLSAEEIQKLMDGE